MMSWGSRFVGCSPRKFGDAMHFDLALVAVAILGTYCFKEWLESMGDASKLQKQIDELSKRVDSLTLKGIR
jgi:hypothetical protein